MKNKKIKYIFVVVFVIVAGFLYLIYPVSEPVQEEFFVDEQTIEAAQSAGKSSDLLQPSGDKGKEEPVARDTKDAEEKLCIYVHICGAVNYPGVYRLKQGDRVVDAVAAAGGFTQEAAQDFCNQAVPVFDGEKIYIPKIQEITEQEQQALIQEQAAAGTDALSGERNSLEKSRLDINTASAEQLCTLTGIGEAKAKAIVAYREAHGKFTKCEDLMKVPGIKDALYGKICDEIVVIP